MSDKRQKRALRKSWPVDRVTQWQANTFWNQCATKGSLMFFQIINGKMTGVILPRGAAKKLSDAIRKIIDDCGGVETVTDNTVPATTPGKENT